MSAGCSPHAQGNCHTCNAHACTPIPDRCYTPAAWHGGYAGMCHPGQIDRGARGFRACACASGAGELRPHRVFSFSPTSCPTGGSAMILQAYSLPVALSAASFTTEKPARTGCREALAHATVPACVTHGERGHRLLLSTAHGLNRSGGACLLHSRSRCRFRTHTAASGCHEATRQQVAYRLCPAFSQACKHPAACSPCEVSTCGRGSQAPPVGMCACMLTKHHPLDAYVCGPHPHMCAPAKLPAGSGLTRSSVQWPSLLGTQGPPQALLQLLAWALVPGATPALLLLLLLAQLA